MKKHYALFSLIIGLLISTKAQAWNYGEFISCSGLNPNPKITFKTSYGELIHDFNTPQREIQLINTKTPEKGYYTSGLATLKIQHNIHIKYAEIRKLDDNATCIMPKEIEVTFGYIDPIIYVSSEYDINSCNFSLILRHEQTHQWINKLTLEYFMPLIHKTIKKTIREVRAVKVPSPEQAQDGIKLLSKYYLAKIAPIIEEYEKARVAEQQKLDNKINYDKESKICQDFQKKHPEKPIFKPGIDKII